MVAWIKYKVKCCTACQDIYNVLVTHHQSPSFTLGNGPPNHDGLNCTCMSIFAVHICEKPFFVLYCGCPFQMDRSCCSLFTFLSSGNANTQTHICYSHGLPGILVSDNGTAFTSAEFQFFVKADGFRHVHEKCTLPCCYKWISGTHSALKRMTGDCLARSV